MERQKIKCLLRVATHCLKKCARGWPPPFLCLLSPSLGSAGSSVQPRPLGSTSVLQEICLAGTRLACACHKIYWRVSVSTKHFVFRRFLFFFSLALVGKYYQHGQCWSAEYTSCSSDSVGMTVGQPWLQAVVMLLFTRSGWKLQMQNCSSN